MHATAGSEHSIASTTLRLAVVLALMASVLVTANADRADAQDPDLLVFVVHPGDATGGSPFGTQPIVEIQDVDGNTVDSALEVTLTLASGPGGAVLNCDPVVATNGVATFGDCSIDLVGTYTLEATASGTTPGLSDPFMVAVGPPAQIVFTQPPGDIVAGESFDPPPAVELRDAGGNPAPADLHAFGLTALDSSDMPVPLSGCTGGQAVVDQGATFYSLTATAGAASAAFADCSVDVAGADYSLLAVAVPDDENEEVLIGFSGTFDVTAGSAMRLAFITQPGGAAPGELLARQPVVALLDGAGNIATAASANVTLSVTDGTAAIVCGGANPIATSGGVAAFAGCSIDTPGIHRLTATSDGGFSDAVSATFAAAVGSVSQLRFATQPGDGTGGSPLQPQPVVEALDAAGVPVPATVSLALDGDPAGVTFDCPNTTAPATGGVAAFHGCDVDRAGSYRLVATETGTGATATSDIFDVTVGDAVVVAITAAPSAAAAGETFAVTVELRDAGGNVATTSGDRVRLTLASGPDSRGTRLTCASGLAVETQSGEATFSGCSVPNPGTYRLTAAADVGVAVSDTFPVSTGPPASLTFVSAPIAASNGGLLATPIVLVHDAGGNTVDTQVALSATGGSLIGCSLTTLAVHGLAAFPGCVLNSAATTVTLLAAAGGASRSVDVPVNQDPPVGTAPVGAPLAQTFGDASLANNPSLVTNDVNGATGALQFSEQDLTVAGVALPFVLTRSYSSADSSVGVFGRGWSSMFDVTVVIDGSIATVRGDDGQRLVFDRNPDCRGNGWCTWLPRPSARASLTCRRSECVIARFDGLRMTTTNGRISSYVARNGRGLAFSYTNGVLSGVSVTTTDGLLHMVDVTVAGGRVTALATPTRTVGYSYTGTLLSGFTDAVGATTAYTYDSAGRLTGRTLGQERLVVTYGIDGRVASAATSGQQRRYHDTYEWALDVATGIGTSTRHTALTAHGTPTVGTHLERYRNNALLRQQTPDGATTAYSFDSNLNLTAVQDPMGGVQRMTYDSRGDLIRQVAADGGTIRLTYDNQHRATSLTDALGNTTAFTYSGAQPNWIGPPDPADPLNQPGVPGETGVHYVYDGFGLLLEVQTPLSEQVLSYDLFGNPTSMQIFDPLDLERTNPLNGNGPMSTYDEAGNVLTTVDPRGHLADGTVDPAFLTTFAYDANGRRTQVTEPGGMTTTTTYTPAGQVASLTQPGQATTTYAWDEAARTRTASGGTSGTWIFDEAGHLLSHVNAAGRTQTSIYDTSGQLVARTEPDKVTTWFTHNALGAVVATADSLGRTAQQTYDASNRPVRTIVNGIVVSTRAYDAAGNLLSEIDAAGQLIAYAYNNHGKLASVSDAAGTTSYGYDIDDNLIAVTDGNGHTTTYGRDAAGREITRTIADGQTWTTGYDVASNIITLTDPDARTTAYTLDARNQRTRIVHGQPGQPAIQVDQVFDAQGRRVGMTDPTGAHTFAYDDRGNLVAAQSPTGDFAYDYATPGYVTTTYPDGTPVTTRYDDNHNVMSLSAPGVSVAYTRNIVRQITGVATGNGLFETRGYDTADRLVSQALTCGTTAVMTTRYGYDLASAPLGSQRTIGAQTTTTGFGYDDAGRLAAQRIDEAGVLSLPTTACTPPSPPAPPSGTPGGNLPPAPSDVNDPMPAMGLSGLTPATANPLGYDAVGNRISAPGVTYSYDAGDRLSGASDGRAATYDAAGNMTSSTVSGQTTTYAYDAAARLVEVTLPDGTIVGYSYDGDGNRVGRSVDGVPATTYAWDRSGPLALLALETFAGGFRRYFHAVGPVALQTGQGTYYLHADRRDNIASVSDATGAIVETYTYDAFGNATVASASGAPDNPLRFGGQYLDADTGLYYLRARNYDPTVGRFTQRDPVIPLIGAPVVSPYAYADNQPTRFTDPTGQVSLPIQDPHATTEGTIVAALTPVIGGTKVIAVKALEYRYGAGPGPETLGRVLTVVGIGLSIYVAVDDCINGTTQQCVASTVSAAFAIGCALTTAGAGALACAVVGAGISFVIVQYGPEIFAAIVAAGGFVGQALFDAPEAIAKALGEFGGAINSGYNELASAFSSGYEEALRLLVVAGIHVGDLALLLKDTFGQALEDVVGQLNAFAYAVEDVALAVVDVFATTPELAAAALKELGYVVTEVSDGLDAAFGAVAGWSEQALADALEGAGYAIDEIAAGLQWVFATTAEEFAAVMDTLNHTASQIADTLSDAYGTAAAEVAGILAALEHSAVDIADALRSVYDETADVVATILDGIGFGVAEVAAALDSAYRDAAGWSAEALADALDAAGYLADEIALGLQSALDSSAEVVADILQGIGYAPTAIADALQSVYDTTAAEIIDVLSAIGATTTEIAGVLSDVYNQTSSAIGNLLGSAGIALDELGGFFTDTVGTVAKKLDPRNWF